jgi:molybdate/tungstate transport system substrate-binding protein
LALAVTAGGVAISARSVSPQSAGQLNICHAGSVQAAFTQVEREFTAQHPGVAVKDVSGGSVALAGRLAAGIQPCDVFAAADYEDIDLLLKPLGLADYTIVFGKGRMVLAYLATDPRTHGIAASGDFNPPRSIPNASPDWYKVLLAPGVRVGGSHPFLDPSGYRAHMIFELAQAYYDVPDLYNLLLEHYAILPVGGGPEASIGPSLGSGYDFQFIYEHSAAAAAKNNPSYRYVAVPDRIDLSTSANNSYYARAVVTIPGIGRLAATSPVTIPGTRVAWGVTVTSKSPNLENAIAFVNLVLGAAGSAALNLHGPDPITPAFVSTGDYPRVPKSLRPLVTAGEAVP